MPSTYKNLGDKRGGDPNIIRIKDVNRERPLDNTVAGWRQHGIEHPSDPEQFTSVVCPGARSCPLCRKPVSAEGKNHFPVSRRFAANTWDYDTNEVKVLVAGPAVFDEFKSAASVGIDPASCDWTITKTGQGLSTKYDVIRHDAAPFAAAQITPDMLHSVDKYEQPTSTEAIFEILEKFGIDYDALTVPSYTYDEALAFVMPYTKHKGLTIEQLVAQEQSYAEWMHGTKLEQGQLGDPVFLALQTVMQEHGLVPSLDEALAMLPEPETEAPASTSTPAPQPTVPQAAPPATAVPAGVSEASAGMVELIGTDGAQVMVPAAAVENLLKAGFRRVEAAPATAADANAPMRVLVGGAEVELPREQALMLVQAGTAQEIPAVAAEPEPPKLPLPDEEVQVDVKGTIVSMPYVQAAAVVDIPAAGASFVDENVAAAHERAKDAGAQAKAQDPSQTPAPVSASTRTHDPEKPFECDQCDAAYKTQGGLTQHKNREHKAAEPQPSAIPAASNGGGLAERVKDLIAHAPFARDFNMLLKIFEEETGERNFAQMDEEQLARLEKRINKEIAAASS